MDIPSIPVDPNTFGSALPMAAMLVTFAGISGLLLKLVDDAFDERAFSARLAMVLCLVDCGLAVTLMLDREGFIIIGAIFWSSLFRGKVDNYAFYLGYAVTGTAWVMLFLMTRPFELGWLVAIGLAVNIASLFITTWVHDFFEDHKNLFTVFFIKYRFMHVSLVSVLLPFGCISFLGIGMLWVFIIGYSAGSRVSAAMSTRWKQKTNNALDVMGDEKDVPMDVRTADGNRAVD